VETRIGLSRTVSPALPGLQQIALERRIVGCFAGEAEKEQGG
jgi:hypothetical protein